MGQNNSSEYRNKSYHSLPQFIERFQDHNEDEDTSADGRISPMYKKTSNKAKHYSIAEHKSKLLLTTITLDDVNERFRGEQSRNSGQYNPPPSDGIEGNNNKYRTRDETNEPQTQETAIFGQKDLESVSAFTKDANNKSEKSSQNADPGFYDSNIENSMAEISQRRSTKKLFKASKYEESKYDKRIGYSSDDHYPKVCDGISVSHKNSMTSKNDEADCSYDLELNKNTRKNTEIARKIQSGLTFEKNTFNTPQRNHHFTSLNLNSVDLADLDLLDDKEDEQDPKEREKMLQMKKKILAQQKKERKAKIQEDTLYRYNRNDMIQKVSKILHQHIVFAETKIPYPSQGAMLFDEKIYLRERWKVHTTHGFSVTLPVFLYGLERVEYKIENCTPEDIQNLIKSIFDELQLAIECILIMLIYIERLMTMGGIEVRLINWKTLVFTGTLLASKFWEDLSFWNVDFLGVGQNYSLEGINQLEKEFLGLCRYDLFVSAKLYAKYYFAVSDKYMKEKKVIKPFRPDKFKLKQSRAGYNMEVSREYENISKKKIDKNYPEDHQQPLLDNY
ncbi:unnamed protein product [Moneuplotes crassus]|uniref:Cyclin N-terminal domain-containing protein n=1 Tax=Euplotes crassus TaxID=5936 RepID=A0AAD1X949_EUPCR|nr:unnamed protein product [Moneuplotes crassus]